MTTETTDPQTDGTIIKELARLAEEKLPATILTLNDGRVFTFRRNDFAMAEITEPNSRPVLMPQIAAAAVAIDTAASFIDYVNRFKNADTVLFASEQDNKIVAAIDYHQGADSAGKVAARTSAHLATLTLRYSDQWKTWTALDEKLSRHVDFATFLEENQFDVTKPAGADLLEICRDLQVKANMNFDSSIRMGDAVSISYQKDEDVSTKQQMTIPVSFETTIPVFFGEPAVKVLNWSRRKVADGSLWLGFKMSQRDLVEANEFARIVAEITAGTSGLTTVFGRRQA